MAYGNFIREINLMLARERALWILCCLSKAGGSRQMSACSVTAPSTQWRAGGRPVPSTAFSKSKRRAKAGGGMESKEKNVAM